MTDDRQTRGTPFHARALAANQQRQWGNWDQCIVASVFENAHDEHRAIRTTVAVGDMSPLSKIEVRGPDARRLVDRVVTKDVSGMQAGQIVFTVWCDEQGKVICDGLVACLAEDRFRFSCDQQIVWLTTVGEGMDVEVVDVSDAFGIMTVQGPAAPAVIAALGGEELSRLPFSRRVPTRFGDVPVEVLRQGFTGELGYELWVATDRAEALWDLVVEAIAPHGGRLAGGHALDAARVEAGLLITGTDYTGTGPDRLGSMIVPTGEGVSSPYELGLGWLVDLDKGDFVGKAALAAEREAPPRRTLCGLTVDSRSLIALYAAADMPSLVATNVSWYPFAVEAGGQVVGRISSMTWSPSVRSYIGLGHLPPAVATAGTEVSIRWSNDGLDGLVAAQVVELPFVPWKRALPA